MKKTPKKYQGKLSLDQLYDTSIKIGAKVATINITEIKSIDIYDDGTGRSSDFHQQEEAELIIQERTIEEQLQRLIDGKKGKICLNKELETWITVEQGIMVSARIKDCSDNLGIKQKEDIEHLFGQADEIDKSRSSRTFYYFERKFSITLTEKDSLSTYLVLGSLGKEPSFIGAKDLLQQYLALASYDRKELEEHEVKLERDPVVFLQLHNFNAFLKALDYLPKNDITTKQNRGKSAVTYIDMEDEKENKTVPLQEHIDKNHTSSINYFERGHFIDHFSTEHYNSVLKIIYEICESNDLMRERLELQRVRQLDVKHLFVRFLAYRLKAEELYNSMGNYMEAGAFFAIFEIHIAEKLNQKVAEDLTFIDDFLCKVLTPDDQKIAIKTIVNDHGYKNVNIDDIKYEWYWMGEDVANLID